MGMVSRKTVDRGRRTEDQTVYARLLHGVKQVDAAEDIVVVITQRVQAAPTALRPAKCITASTGWRARARSIASRWRRSPSTSVTACPGQLRYLLKNRWLAVAEIVQHNHLVAGFQQGHTGMAADIAGATCDKNGAVAVLGHAGIVFMLSCSSCCRFCHRVISSP